MKVWAVDGETEIEGEMKTPQCDGSKTDCNRAIKEIIRLEGRWSTLKSRIEQEILDLCDTAADRTVREICAEQEGMMRIQEIIKELGEK